MAYADDKWIIYGDRVILDVETMQSAFSVNLGVSLVHRSRLDVLF
jgi:hypothetical protein